MAPLILGTPIFEPEGLFAIGFAVQAAKHASCFVDGGHHIAEGRGRGNPVLNLGHVSYSLNS